MKRLGIHKPTIEDIIEISGIETLHPGGFALTKRTAEIANLKPGMTVLDVSSGRGTQAIYYAQEFGVKVTGIDISKDMVAVSNRNAFENNLSHQVNFVQGDSQYLPFEANTFDAVINECAVGIPDDSQKVLSEMVRVAKLDGAIAIHESTWRKSLSDSEKEEFSERYGTTPLEYEQWIRMLENAGVQKITTEFEQWSKPELFWNIRKDRQVTHFSKVLTFPEKIKMIKKVFRRYNFKGIIKAFENEKKFFAAVLNGTLGYCLYKGVKA